MKQHIGKLLCVILLLCLMLPAAFGETAAKDSMVFVVGAEPQSLDVHNTRANSDEMVAWHIYESLVTRNNPELEVRPGLAESWTVSKDGLVWTFKLRKGVKFHDGTPFNAQAVKYNFDRLLDSKNPTIKSGVFNFIEQVEVVDDYTVKLINKFPFGAVLAHLAHPGGGIASPAALEKYGSRIGDNPVGTGPYRLKTWVPGDRIVLERYDGYSGTSKPKMREIVFKVAREEATRVMMLETGEADVATNIPPDEAERLKSNPNLQVLRCPTNRVIYIGMNNLSAPFDNVKVRQAVNYAVDKEAILEHVLNGYGGICDSPVAPLTWGYVDGKRYEYNPEKAKQLLKEAGVAPGTRIKLWAPQGRYLKDAETAQAVAGYLSAVGFNVDFQIMEWGAYTSKTTVVPEKAEHQLFLMGGSPSTADADWLLRAVLTTDSLPPVGYNSYYYSNKVVDELVVKAQRTVDPEERLALYGKIQEELREDAPWLFLTIMENVAVAKKDLGGLIISPLEYVFAYDAYFK